MANRLSNESSPYLRQHAGNPVDWYPWSDEALQKARTENKPILLSVGYSACHWCHVMAHECFENDDIAAIMNQYFVNIKVDREERPDLDQIYQNVAQLITRSGGWPLTVFLTPDLKPFFGGTYFPPADKYGRPGFPKVLKSLADMFQKDPKAISDNAQRLISAIDRLETLPSPAENERPSAAGLKKISEELLQAVDWDEGGFGGAPKFPNTMNLSYFWRYGQATKSAREQEAVLLTLTKMACGGIYDQLGGGFSRYSVDANWAVPHFEKMLYDNALLLKLYAEVLLTEVPVAPLLPSTRKLYTNVLCETIEYVLREMQSPLGGFYAAQDADSEGEEGKFFIWSTSDLNSLLSTDEAQAFSKAYGVTEYGNFVDPHVPRSQGQTVLFRALQGTSEESIYESPLVLSAKAKLFAARSKRVAPGRDDKILTAWNGLMISGLLWAAQALELTAEPSSANKTLAAKARQAALDAYQFVTSQLTYDGNRLWSVYGGGKAKFNGYLDDYAFMSMAALDVARLGRNDSLVPTAFQNCQSWVDVVLTKFKDAAGIGYFFTSADHETLIQRPKTIYDQAIPSGIAMVLGCLAVLAEATALERYATELDKQTYGLFPMALKNPFGLGEMSCVSLAQVLGPVLISGSTGDGPLVTFDAIRHPYVWIKPPAANDSSQGALVCHNKTCSLPLSDLAMVSREASQHFML